MQKIFIFFLLISVLTLTSRVETQLPVSMPETEDTEPAVHYDGSSLVNNEDPPPTVVSCEIEKDQLLLNDQGVIIKTLRFENDEDIGPKIWVNVENQNDNPIDLQCVYIVINGIMIPDIFSCRVDANSTSDEFFFFTDDPFAKYGIDTIADIQVVFELLDQETLEPYYTSDTVEIKTSQSGRYAQEYDSSGDVVYEDENFKVVYQGMSDYQGYDPTLHFYVENNSTKPIAVSSSDFSLNDGKCDYSPLMWCDMLPQTKAYATVTLVSTEMNQLDAGELENMAFYIELIEPNTYEHYLDIGPIVINMETESASVNDTGL